MKKPIESRIKGKEMESRRKNLKKELVQGFQLILDLERAEKMEERHLLKK